jgi:hypothetical protein
LEDGEEEGTSNNVYYLTTYTPITGDRVRVHRQNRLCKPCWLSWTEDYKNWQNHLVLVQQTPGPASIGIGDPKRGELVPMWDFLIKARVLPPRPNPIYATYGELEGPPDELVQGIRDDLTKLRGKLQDLMRAYPLWADWLKAPEGGITCVISSLYGGMQEMQKHRAKWGHKPDWLRPRSDDAL